ncbi:putative DNA helicase/primase [Cedratvirus kamchatka]|uniref:DNA helicase/primase n=1 Tax=Cedratvirus kamchatka TaxID=2716914 RepID=A0A6G8MXM9_9VIRU|nr:putative DNA helicase/primase [Cedratvirus kamchatka]WIL04134.1 divergent replication origin-binding protein [Cedratvirus lena]WIL04747.1 divergent replication origin-binding protein [Cedratvirus duvanny]
MGDIRWFRFLNNKDRDSLNRHYALSSGLIVRQERIDGNYYAYFRSHIDFATKTRRLPKNFHEVVMGRQKARFDFDKAKTKEELDKAVEEVCLATMKIVPLVRPEDFIYFTSHSEERFSAHLVINNHYYRNHIQARELFNLVSKEISPQSLAILDSGVYSSVQCFRMLNNSKLGETRPKKYEKLFLGNQEYTFTTKHERMYDMELLRASLLGQVEGCALLPDLVDESRPEGHDDLEDDVVREVMKFCRSKIRDFPFRKRSIEGNMIALQRVHPSLCPGCKRIHENENPYIKINAIDIYFVCRRGRPIYLGQLGENSREPFLFEERENAEVAKFSPF